MLEQVLLGFGTLFPVVNPVSTAFVFNALTARKTQNSRRHIARIAALTAALVLLSFALIGHAILHFFSVTVYAFRVAGGLYLAKVGFDMLQMQLRRDPEAYDDGPDDIAIIPLAIPLLAGPGSLTATLVLADGATGAAIIPILFSILLICLISWVALRHAHAVDKLLGETGTIVVQRLLGLIVLVIAVQFLFNGVSGYLAASP